MVGSGIRRAGHWRVLECKHGWDCGNYFFVTKNALFRTDQDIHHFSPFHLGSLFLLTQVIDFSHWYYVSAVQFASTTTTAGNATSLHSKPVAFDETVGSIKDEAASLPAAAPQASTILDDANMFVIALMATLGLWLSGSWIEHLLRRQESVARAEARERKRRKERARIGNGSTSRASRVTTPRE